MATYPVLDSQTALDQLRRPLPNIFTNEEEAHPWQVRSFQQFDMPLLRIWDQYSGSHPEADGRMMSRAPGMRLDDRESRRTSFSCHLVHNEWKPTPYISFTTRKTTIESLVDMRRAKRGDQTLTVIDPNTRLRNGLPILDAEVEMDYYDISDPYGKICEYYRDHYLCLWQVTAAEIVDHWEWSRLEGDPNWYEDIILPAFKKFTEKTATRNVKSLLAESETGQPTKDSKNTDLEHSLALMVDSTKSLDVTKGTSPLVAKPASSLTHQSVSNSDISGHQTKYVEFVTPVQSLPIASSVRVLPVRNRSAVSRPNAGAANTTSVSETTSTVNLLSPDSAASIASDAPSASTTPASTGTTGSGQAAHAMSTPVIPTTRSDSMSTARSTSSGKVPATPASSADKCSVPFDVIN
ncbi:hypothetical protein F4823DRAFT_605915 [Ustulina deusta]|nr:hypothetical protein F4823DRAFT_605915 [Ustulina deusta]